MGDDELKPRFGDELKMEDGFKPVNAWASNTILWLDDIQQFYRDRSAIEKEYASKLSTLAKKYFDKKAKRSSIISVGETPTATPGSLESASMTTWAVQLTTLETRAAEHDQFSNDLLTQLADPLRGLQARCEELRKFHAEAAAKLESDRDAAYADLKKVKSKYYSVCQDHESRRKKTESAIGKSSAQAAFQQHQADMLNAKASYLISIAVTNKAKERYYNQFVPDLLDSLQDLSEARTAKTNSIWLRAAALEVGTLARSTDAVQRLSSEIPRNNPLLDSVMFIQHNIPNWQEPANYTFEPSPLWLDDDVMPATEGAKTFLRNIQVRSKEQLGELRPEVDKRRRELENSKKVRVAIREGKDKRDELDATKLSFQMQEQLHEVEKKKIAVEMEFAIIASTVGDLSKGARNHNFRSQTFKIPTNCDLCGERIWGLSAKGFDCRDCGFTCHSKCEMKVPATCPGEQDKDEKRRLKVVRQEEAHAAPIPEPETPSTPHHAAPALARSDTANSMNTLSSGYAASAMRSVSGATAPTSADESPTSPSPATAAPAAAKPATAARRNRIVAPPPAAYVTSAPPDRDGGPASNGLSEKRAKMIYPYEANGDGEISVDEGKEVVVVEPDDGSGWMKVRAGGSTGLVPAAYAELIASSTSNDRPLSSYSASSGGSGPSGPTSAGKKKGPAVAPKRGAKKLQQAEALYDYDARSDAEHSMREGERFVLVKRDTGDGWADVEKGGMVKSVPASYIQEI